MILYLLLSAQKFHHKSCIAQKPYSKFTTVSAELHWDMVYTVTPFDTMNEI
jgi:hypothetical protein